MEKIEHNSLCETESYKGLTDNDIIKALECCDTREWCNDCPCKDVLSNQIVDLINRQHAEIETLKTNNHSLCLTLSNRARVERTEAIKEFWDKLKEEQEYLIGIDDKYKPYVACEDGDNLVKEMTEGKE